MLYCLYLNVRFNNEFLSQFCESANNLMLKQKIK